MNEREKGDLIAYTKAHIHVRAYITYTMTLTLLEARQEEWEKQLTIGGVYTYVDLHPVAYVYNPSFVSCFSPTLHVLLLIFCFCFSLF